MRIVCACWATVDIRSVSNATQSIRVLRCILYNSVSRSCLLLFVWSGQKWGERGCVKRPIQDKLQEKERRARDRKVKPTNPPTLGHLQISPATAATRPIASSALRARSLTSLSTPPPMLSRQPRQTNPTRCLSVFSIPAARSSAVPHASSMIALTAAHRASGDCLGAHRQARLARSGAAVRARD